MSDIALTDDLFYNRTGMDIKRVESLTDNAIGDCDDCELFLEYRQSESITSVSYTHLTLPTIYSV